MPQSHRSCRATTNSARRSPVELRAAPDAGQATVALAGVVVVLAALAFAVAELGAAAATRARAQSAADAAALAGAVEGEAAAHELAAANGATLERFDRVCDDVVVAVRLGRATARARARLEPAARSGSQPVAVHSARCPWSTQG